MKPYLKPLVILVPVLILLGYLFVSYSNKSEFSEEDVSKAQQLAKAYETLDIAETLDWKNNKVELASSKAPVLIIHFWASWCGPCLQEFPDLLKMAKNQKGKVVVLAVSEDSEEGEIKAFVKSFSEAETTPNFHIAWDKDHEFMKRWNVDKLPESFIYGPDRKMKKHVSGAVPWNSEDSQEYFKMIEADGKNKGF